jgi:hypothetical protein
MKIGFFGDSFTAKLYNMHSLWNGYSTYIKQISKNYNADIVNLGHGGSSIWDTILIQLNPLIKSNSVPDICVFVWTNPGRLFHREVRRINHSDALESDSRTPQDIWNAAKQYYLHLYDQEKEEIEHLAMLHYIDNNIIPLLPKSTKVIHMWTSANPLSWENEDFHPEKISYPYKWKHGVEIRPPLLCLSLVENNISILQKDKRPNHLEGTFKNELVTKWVTYAIENYKDGMCLDHTSDIAKLWDQ